ncbi:hypothetical protein 2204_scaffold14_00052 [Bacteriophage sp.]|nr:hypothetical protein 2204_scaffold14_00052 [Bacteriophage sp.]
MRHPPILSFVFATTIALELVFVNRFNTIFRKFFLFFGCSALIFPNSRTTI